MATHSSILAWRIPWTEEPGRLQFKGHKDLNTTDLLSMPTCMSVEGCCQSGRADVSDNKFSAFLVMKRGEKLGSEQFLLKMSDYLKACSATFSRAQNASFLISTLNSFQGVLKISKVNDQRLHSFRTRGQREFFVTLRTIY